MSYKDSDYTIVNCSCVLTKMYEFGCWNSLWWWSYEHFCHPVGCHCSSTCFDVRWQYSSQERERPMKILIYTAKNAIIHWHLGAKTHPGSKVVSAVIIFCFLLAPLLTQLEQHAYHIMCANWNELLAVYVIRQPLSKVQIRAGGCKQCLPRYLQSQGPAIYQECSYHLKATCMSKKFSKNEKGFSDSLSNSMPLPVLKPTPSLIWMRWDWGWVVAFPFVSVHFERWRLIGLLGEIKFFTFSHL